MKLVNQFSFKQTVSTLAISTLVAASGAVVVEALTAQPAFAQSGEGNAQGGSGNQGGSDSQGGSDNQGGSDSQGGAGGQADAGDRGGSDNQGGQTDQGAGGGEGLGGTTGVGDDKGARGSDPVESADSVDEGSGPPDGKGGKGNSGSTTSDTNQGDLYGDLFVIVRNDDGVPIDADGNVVSSDADVQVVADTSKEGWEEFVIDPDAETPLLDKDIEGWEDYGIEVELGRLNVGRAPTSVLDNRADEVIQEFELATDISLDAAGRLVLTIDGEEKTIDSPLENLAVYVALITLGYIPDLESVPNPEFDYLVDPDTTDVDENGDPIYEPDVRTEDLEASPAFLAAATDKTGEFTIDEIAYINAFLGIETVETDDGLVTYSDVDYSSFTYDRWSTFGDATADIMVDDGTGSFVPAYDVPIYELVFEDYDDTDANEDGVPDNLDDFNVVVSGTLDAYTQAAEDARVVIEYIHEMAIIVPPEPVE